ncbi:MAG: RHS repeat-associated core domain-containing protein, partial [Terrimicrobiaceae bacterium]
TYDAADRLASITVSNGSTVLWAERYGYNAAGERTYTLHGDSGTAGDGYWLDTTSQLRGVKYGAADATQAYSSQSGQSAIAEWQYDEVGNRTAETESGGTTTYVSDTTNQYTSVSSVDSVVYSDRGDLAQFGDWTYSYDAQGNLIRANNSQTNVAAQYWRDAFGHRAVKDVNGSKAVFFNIGTTQLEAYDVTSETASSTIHEPGIDRPLAQVSASGALTFYHQDFLGSVVLLTDASGTKLQSFTYDVWGKASGFDASGASLPVSSFASRFLYTAREYDTETELYHYRARAYSPALGRFLQTDPIDFGGGDVNLFRYVSNNPVNLWDPLGLSPSDWWDIPAKIGRAQEIANDELAKHHGHNDCDDANRHAEWSKRMADELGGWFSDLVGTGHELEGLLNGAPFDETVMDLNNNKEGRNSSREGRDINQNNLRTAPNGTTGVGGPYGY